MKRRILIATVALVSTLTAVTLLYVGRANSRTTTVALAAPPTSIADCSFDPETFISQVNTLRASKGLTPVTEANSLDASAKARVADMVKYNYYGHVNPYTGITAGQTIARFDSDAGSAEILDGPLKASDAFPDFVHSPEHYDIMMAPSARYIGVYEAHTAGPVPGYDNAGKPTGVTGRNFCTIVADFTT